MNGKEIFVNAALLTEQNCEQALFFMGSPKEYFKDLKDCAEVIALKYKDVVTGLWYIGMPAVDGGTQFVFRTREELTDMSYRNRLHRDIYEFTGHEMCYFITDESIDDLYSIPIEEWTAQGKVYALYDTERGVC